MIRLGLKMKNEPLGSKKRRSTNRRKFSVSANKVLGSSIKIILIENAKILYTPTGQKMRKNLSSNFHYIRSSKETILKGSPKKFAGAEGF